MYALYPPGNDCLRRNPLGTRLRRKKGGHPSGEGTEPPQGRTVCQEPDIQPMTSFNLSIIMQGQCYIYVHFTKARKQGQEGKKFV